MCPLYVKNIYLLYVRNTCLLYVQIIATIIQIIWIDEHQAKSNISKNIYWLAISVFLSSLKPKSVKCSVTFREKTYYHKKPITYHLSSQHYPIDNFRIKFMHLKALSDPLQSHKRVFGISRVWTFGLIFLSREFNCNTITVDQSFFEVSLQPFLSYITLLMYVLLIIDHPDTSLMIF